MSWSEYVNNNLVGAGLKSAQIIGAEGGSWATSAGFALKPNEEKLIVDGFKKPENFSATGILANGVKYFCLKSDARSVYGKQGTGGIVLVKTTKAIVIGVYDEKLQPGQAANVVEKLADYLIDQSY